MNWVRGDVVAWCVTILFRGKSPPSIIVSMQQTRDKDLHGVPFSPICQCTDVYGRISSKPFNFRTMRALWAAERQKAGIQGTV